MIIKTDMKKFLVTIMVLLPMLAFGQDAAMLSMARGELAKRGLNETEVRARLLEEGIDVDNIPPTEYKNYEGRVTAILNQMQAEKAAKGETVVASGDADANDGTALIEGAAADAKTPNDFPQTTAGEAAAEAALEANKDVNGGAGNDIYGHSLFANKTLDVYRTTDGAQAPDTYILGEGDEVHISIFGSSQTEIHQRIGNDGSIQPAGVSKIFLKGMTLAQGRQAIRTRLAQHYSFRPDQIAVTITTARTLNVNIYGEVGVNGGFTVSALNTAFNALAAAGGPTAIGSVRNILHTRGDKSTTIDLYQYMINPDIKAMYDLQNNDGLYVPVAQKIVSIEGPVNRAMRYELIEGETLIDLIGYAGGLRYDVYPNFVQIERYQNGEVNYLEYDLENVINGSQKVDLINGDIVRLRTANKPNETFVSISGDVYYGGNYDLAKNNTLKTLIENAKPTFTAKTDFVFVERTRPDETVEVLTIPFPGVDGNPDFDLEARDVVRVLSLSTYRDVESISVNGQVRNPFTRNFGLNDRMTVSQAIDYAGGLKQSVYPVAYIFRKDLKNPAKMEYISVNLEQDGETLLQPGDQLNIYDNTTYVNVGELRVSGAVKNPVGVTYDASLSVHDLLTMAGGFTVGAAFDKVEVFRVNISKKDEAKLDLITLAVDENYELVGKDFQLQPYDHIVVRMTPNFTMGRVVEVNGRVKYPGSYVMTDSKTQLWEIIEMAGGLLDDADPFARLFRTYNGRGNIGLDLRDVKNHKGSLNSDPILMDGDVINIVRQENTVIIRETGTRMSQYVPADYASTQKIMVYQGGHNAAWYIRHYAGGFVKTADRSSVTVTMPNNQCEATKTFLGIHNYPTVEPGGVITVAIDEKKREKIEKPKEEVDWNATLARCLTTLTSTVSLIVLIQRL